MTAVLDVPLAAASWTAIGTGIRLVVTDPYRLGRRGQDSVHGLFPLPSGLSPQAFGILSVLLLRR